MSVNRFVQGLTAAAAMTVAGAGNAIAQSGGTAGTQLTSITTVVDGNDQKPSGLTFSKGANRGYMVVDLSNNANTAYVVYDGHVGAVPGFNPAAIADEVAETQTGKNPNYSTSLVEDVIMDGDNVSSLMINFATGDEAARLLATVAELQKSPTATIYNFTLRGDDLYLQDAATNTVLATNVANINTPSVNVVGLEKSRAALGKEIASMQPSQATAVANTAVASTPAAQPPVDLVSSPSNTNVSALTPVVPAVAPPVAPAAENTVATKVAASTTPSLVLDGNTDGKIFRGLSGNYYAQYGGVMFGVPGYNPDAVGEVAKNPSTMSLTVTPLSGQAAIDAANDANAGLNAFAAQIPDINTLKFNGQTIAQVTPDTMGQGVFYNFNMNPQSVFVQPDGSVLFTGMAGVYPPALSANNFEQTFEGLSVRLNALAAETRQQIDASKAANNPTLSAGDALGNALFGNRNQTGNSGVKPDAPKTYDATALHSNPVTPTNSGSEVPAVSAATVTAASTRPAGTVPLSIDGGVPTVAVAPAPTDTAAPAPTDTAAPASLSVNRFNPQNVTVPGAPVAPVPATPATPLNPADSGMKPPVSVSDAPNPELNAANDRAAKAEEALKSALAAQKAAEENAKKAEAAAKAAEQKAEKAVSAAVEAAKNSGGFGWGSITMAVAAGAAFLKAMQMIFGSRQVRKLEARIATLEAQLIAVRELQLGADVLRTVSGKSKTTGQPSGKAGAGAGAGAGAVALGTIITCLGTPYNGGYTVDTSSIPPIVQPMQQVATQTPSVNNGGYGAGYGQQTIIGSFGEGTVRATDKDGFYLLVQLNQIQRVA